MMARMFKPPKSARALLRTKQFMQRSERPPQPRLRIRRKPGKGRSVKFPSDGESLSEGFYLEVSCWP